jgi:C4-dicarboxylate-binding protein DctP
MINLKVWNKLPKDVQKVLQDAAADATRYTIQRADGEDDTAIKFMSEKLKLHVLSDQERKAWKDAMRPVREKFLDRTGKDGETVMNLLGEM